MFLDPNSHKDNDPWKQPKERVQGPCVFHNNHGQFPGLGRNLNVKSELGVKVNV